MKKIHDIEKNFLYCDSPENISQVSKLDGLFDIMPPNPDGFLNYFHFLCQHLPRIYYAKFIKKEELSKLPLFFKAVYYSGIFGDEKSPRDKFKEDCGKNNMLNQFFKILEVSPEDFYIPQKGELVICKERFHIPGYNILNGWRWSEEGLNFYKKYFDFLKSKALDAHAKSFDVVLIKREQQNKLTPDHIKGPSFGVRGISNFIEVKGFLEDYCKKKGLTLGVLKHGSDNFITSDSKILIGAHGAGLTNMVFMADRRKHDSQVIELASEDFFSRKQFALYEFLAKSLGRKYTPLSCEYSHQGHEVDIRKIEKVLGL